MINDIMELFEALPAFAITYSTLVAFGGLFYVAAARKVGGELSLLGLVKYCFPPDFYFSRSALMDLALYLCLKVLKFLLRSSVILGLAGMLVSLARLAFGEAEVAEPTVLVTLVSVAAYFIVKEFGDWYTHYLGHKVPVLWELHKVHHSATSLIPLTSLRGHPLEFVLVDSARAAISALPLAIVCYFYGFNPLVFLVYAGLFNKAVITLSLDPLRHSHIPLGLGAFDRIFISPHMHQVHHSKREQHWDKNFATSLSVFDWIFGTAYRPEKGEQVHLGIGDDSEDAHYSTFRGGFITPLANIARMTGGKNAATEATGA
jgi:sterol desaturase/sphingolipid hydroxylase (fatty acid hydroxylase superfamily)